MYRMREGWTDERMDDFAKHVDDRFDTVDRRFNEVDRRFEEIDKRFDRVDADMRELRKDVNTRFEGLQRTLLLSNAAIIAGLIGVIATQV